MRIRTPRRIIGTTLVIAAFALAFILPASDATPERTYGSRSRT